MSADREEPLAETRGVTRPVALLLAGGAVVLIVAGLKSAAWLVGPVFLAGVIVLLLHPVYEAMRGRRVPAALALPLFLAAVYGLVIAFAAILVFAVAQLATLLPQYAAEVTALRSAISDRLSVAGIGRAEIRELTAALDVSLVTGQVRALLRALTGFGAFVVFLLSLLLFMTIEAIGIGRYLNMADRRQPYLATALRGFAVKTRRYLAVTALFAVLVGVADTVLLWWLGIPLAPLWGLLAALCNFIPYVGFVIGVIPPAVLALLGGDWRLMVVVIVAYILLNSVLTTLLPPYFVGEAVDLPVVITLISIIFWAWVLGPLGAILAVPLTLLAKALLIDADPRFGVDRPTSAAPFWRRRRQAASDPPAGEAPAE